MKEYPHTSREFTVNGKVHKMRKLTLGLQSDIEDDNIDVTIAQVVQCSTDLTDDDIKSLDLDQFGAIYKDITTFTYETNKSEDGETKKP